MSQGETGLTPRWTDKLFLDNEGNIRDFNNNKLGFKVIFDKDQLQEIVDKRIAEMVERPRDEGENNV